MHAAAAAAAGDAAAGDAAIRELSALRIALSRRVNTMK
jgi:hypothetical protein